uniref:SFRICE_022203 n=1 Tax=Spodoptera frugiperda TaxID=7108 RepID=A0A2H1VTR9_SPOFR
MLFVSLLKTRERQNRFGYFLSSIICGSPGKDQKPRFYSVHTSHITRTHRHTHTHFTIYYIISRNIPYIWFFFNIFSIYLHIDVLYINIKYIVWLSHSFGNSGKRTAL